MHRFLPKLSECACSTFAFYTPTNAQLVPGTVITGVESRPELNGRRGDVVGFSEDTGRYVLAVQGETGTIALRPANVVLPRGTCVTITDLQSESAQRHNGRAGTVVDFDPDAGRYLIQLPDAQEQLSLKLPNARL